MAVRVVNYCHTSTITHTMSVNYISVTFPDSLFKTAVNFLIVVGFFLCITPRKPLFS
ncbi:MAG: hypothetical protein K2K97_02005 [Muribaculaceae bacterium]|nr:hypothetical protein [Muribaculaceae bacterium]